MARILAIFSFLLPLLSVAAESNTVVKTNLHCSVVRFDLEKPALKVLFSQNLTVTQVNNEYPEMEIYRDQRSIFKVDLMMHDEELKTGHSYLALTVYNLKSGKVSQRTSIRWPEQPFTDNLSGFTSAYTEVVSADEKSSVRFTCDSKLW